MKKSFKKAKRVLVGAYIAYVLFSLFMAAVYFFPPVQRRIFTPDLSGMYIDAMAESLHRNTELFSRHVTTFSSVAPNVRLGEFKEGLWPEGRVITDAELNETVVFVFASIEKDEYLGVACYRLATLPEIYQGKGTDLSLWERGIRHEYNAFYSHRSKIFIPVSFIFRPKNGLKLENLLYNRLPRYEKLPMWQLQSGSDPIIPREVAFAPMFGKLERKVDEYYLGRKAELRPLLWMVGIPYFLGLCFVLVKSARKTKTNKEERPKPVPPSPQRPTQVCPAQSTIAVQILPPVFEAPPPDPLAVQRLKIAKQLRHLKAMSERPPGLLPTTAELKKQAEQKLPLAETMEALISLHGLLAKAIEQESADRSTIGRGIVLTS